MFTIQATDEILLQNFELIKICFMQRHSCEITQMGLKITLLYKM